MVLVQTLRGGGEREKERQRERQTERDPHTHTQSEKNRETELRQCRLGQQRDSIYSERGRH